MRKKKKGLIGKDIRITHLDQNWTSSSTNLLFLPFVKKIRLLQCKGTGGRAISNLPFLLFFFFFVIYYAPPHSLYIDNGEVLKDSFHLGII